MANIREREFPCVGPITARISVMVRHLSPCQPERHHRIMDGTPRRCPLCGNLVCRHSPISAAGQKVSDVVTNLRLGTEWDLIKHGWMAFRLEDGWSDGVLYDSRADAIRYHRNRADKYFYFQMKMAIAGLPPDHATQMLAMTRVQALRGRYNPSEESLDPIPRLTMQDYLGELYTTAQGVNPE